MQFICLLHLDVLIRQAVIIYLSVMKNVALS